MRKIFLIAVAVAGVVVAVAFLRGLVCEELNVLCGFANVDQLRQSLNADAYQVTDFAQDGRRYVGVMLLPSECPLALRHTQFFHQAAPIYVFDNDGRKVDFTRNHNDDHAFFHRWTEMFPNVTRCGCGWHR